MNKKVYIFLADGFEDIEGLTVVDLMRRADIDIKTVSIKKSKEITTSHGITMLTDLTFAETDFTDADMLVLPGGMPGTKYLNEYQPLRDLLTDFYKQGGNVAAMEGLAGAERSLESVVVDGNVTTSRGLGTAVDFALSLIGQLLGEKKADKIAESVVYSRK